MENSRTDSQGVGGETWRRWKLNGIDTKVIQLKLEMRTELGGWWEPKDKPKQAWPPRPNAWDEYASTKAHAGGNANQAGRSLWGSTAKASCGWTTNPDAKGWNSKLGCSDWNRETLLGKSWEDDFRSNRWSNPEKQAFATETVYLNHTTRGRTCTQDDRAGNDWMLVRWAWKGNSREATCV